MRQCPKCGKRFLESNARICDVDGAVLDLLVVASERDRLVGTTILNRYAVDGVLGDGGMGVVYRARDTATGGRVAVKVLRAEYTAEQDLVVRFEQEARAAAAVQNPHIVEIYDWGSLPDSSRFFVMEYLQGRSLGDLLARMPKPPGADRRQPFPEDFALHLTMQIADGLGAAHAAGIVHRDIKPDNFHIVPRPDDPYFVKILDFGIAKVQNSKAARTRTGSVFGTPHYMSPEQASGDRNIDATTDIYGLGVLLYEMVSGKVPFDADNLMGILTAHLYHTPVSPRVYPECANLSASLEAVILKCLAKTREARYASMEELHADLVRCRNSETSYALEDQECRTVRFARTSLPEGLRPDSAPAPVPPSHPPRDGSGSLASVPSVVVDTHAVGSTGAHRSRVRAPLVAAVLGSGAAVGVAVFALIGINPPASPQAPPATQGLASPSRAHEPAPAPTVPLQVPGVGQAPHPGVAPSTVTIDSDPPQATVYRGREVFGTAPVEVPRPARGEDVYEVAAPGRERMAVRVRADAPRVLRVALPPEARRAPRERNPRDGRDSRDPAPTQVAPAAPTTPARPTRPVTEIDSHDPWAH